MAVVICEYGYERASVTAVCARAGVGRRTFYSVFKRREDCFLAVLEEGHARACTVVEHAFERSSDWLEGLRIALAELLLFFEAEPHIARVCMVESLTVGGWALDRREQHIASVTQLVVGYWRRVAPGEPYPFAGVSTMAAVLAIVQREPLVNRSEPLICLLGPLIRVIASPYLESRTVAAEVLKAERLAAMLIAEHEGGRQPSRIEGEARTQLPAMLLDTRAHRARKALLYVAAKPGASNRQIAREVGVASDTQASTLLARLAGGGLLRKELGGAGRPNAWWLTSHGEGVAVILRRLSECSVHTGETQR